MTLVRTAWKYRQLRATHRALKVFTKKLNYTYVVIPGSNGVHVTNLFDLFEIRMGGDQSLEDLVITFSHELGHALDLIHTPMGLEERRDRLAGKHDTQLLCREVAAWGFGQKLLRDMNCYKYVEERFAFIKERGLSTYVQAVEKAVLKINK